MSWSCYNGHEVVVQAGAGVGSRFPDDEYAAAGAKIVPTADDVFDAADLIVKVKEPVPAEYHRFRPGQQLFTYLHLAADRGSPSSSSTGASTPSPTRPSRPPTASSRCSRP